MTANRPLCAPICAGDAVGELIFCCNGEEIARVPLRADADSAVIPPRPSVLDQLRGLFAGENTTIKASE
jgi:hypothetical protein